MNLGSLSLHYSEAGLLVIASSTDNGLKTALNSSGRVKGRKGARSLTLFRQESSNSLLPLDESSLILDTFPSCAIRNETVAQFVLAAYGRTWSTGRLRRL